MTYHETDESSNVHGYRYDADARELHVTFRKRDGSTGSTYVYSGVEPEHYQGMKDTGSHGAYIARHIKDAYPYQRK